jgi:HK97 family phage portal protein
MTPRIYGTPSAKAARIIKSKDDFVGALRENDQKRLAGLHDDERGLDLFGGTMSIAPGIRTHQFSGYASYLEAGTKKVWCAARAVDITANVVISTDMKIVHRDAEARKKKKAIKVDPDLLRLLANPNPFDTISEMLYLWVAHIKFTGNAFWYKDQMNALGQPLHLYPLNPRQMSIVPGVKEKIKEYIYHVNGTEVHFTPDEIIHWKRPHANNPLWGLGDIEQGESLYEDFINRALYKTRFMANGAMPSGILVQEDFEGEQEDWDKKKAAFQENYGGVKNTGKVAWMNGKWSLLQMGITAAEMQEMEKDKINVEQIFLNHGVPLSVAGFGSANFATARVEEMNHRKHTCLPLVNLFTDKINSPEGGLIQAFHPTLKLDFALTGLIDVEQVMKDYAPLADRGGATPNDLREFAGLPRVDNPLLDQYFIRDYYIPLEMAGLAEVTPIDDEVVKQKPKPKETEQAA